MSLWMPAYGDIVDHDSVADLYTNNLGRVPHVDFEIAKNLKGLDLSHII